MSAFEKKFPSFKPNLAQSYVLNKIQQYDAAISRQQEKEGWVEALKWTLAHKWLIEELYDEDGSQIAYVIDARVIIQELEALDALNKQI